MLATDFAILVAMTGNNCASAARSAARHRRDVGLLRRQQPHGVADLGQAIERQPIKTFHDGVAVAEMLMAPVAERLDHVPVLANIAVDVRLVLPGRGRSPARRAGAARLGAAPRRHAQLAVSAVDAAHATGLAGAMGLNGLCLPHPAVRSAAQWLSSSNKGRQPKTSLQ